MEGSASGPIDLNGSCRVSLKGRGQDGHGEPSGSTILFDCRWIDDLDGLVDFHSGDPSASFRR